MRNVLIAAVLIAATIPPADASVLSKLKIVALAPWNIVKGTALGFVVGVEEIYFEWCLDEED